jgi:drug/metabolite transporter (DMT)-like permease
MTLQVLLVVLASALLHASWNALVRGAADKFSSTVWVVGGAAVWSLPLLGAADLPLPASWPYLLASVLIHGVYFTLVALAYQGSALGVAYPLMRGTAPALTALLGVLWLGESLSLGTSLGVGLVCLGVLGMGVGIVAWRSPAHRSAKAQRSTVLLALLNAGVIALYTLVDAQGVRLAGQALGYALALFMGTALLMGLLALLRQRWQRPGASLSLSQGLRLAAWGGAGTLGAYALVLWAFTQAPVASVAALRETSMVFALLLGSVFLKERTPWPQWLAVLLIVAGAVSLKLA